jgi:hypothetical protein
MTMGVLLSEVFVCQGISQRVSTEQQRGFSAEQPVEPLAQAELSPGAAGVEPVVAATSFLLSEEGGAHPA